MTNNKILNRILGTQSAGWATGDDKTLSQMLRGKVVTSGITHRGQVVGALQREIGDTHHTVRTMAMPRSNLQNLLQHSSHPHLGFGSANAEDVSILLDHNIRYGENRALRMEGSTLMSTKLTEILDAPSHQLLRDAFMGEGVTNAIGRFMAEGTEESIAKAKLLSEQRKLSRTDLIAELPQGGYQPGGKDGTFMIERGTWLDRIGAPFEERPGQLTFHGWEENRLQTADKTMGMKRVIGGEMSRAEGQYMAALYRHGESAGLTGSALDDFYREGMGHYNKQAARMAEAGMGLSFAHKTMRPGMIDEAAWATATRGLDDLQFLDPQGLKKIGGRTMDFAVEGMMSEIAYEADLSRARWNEHAWGLRDAVRQGVQYKEAGAYLDFSNAMDRIANATDNAAESQAFSEMNEARMRIHAMQNANDAPGLTASIAHHAEGLATERARYHAAIASTERAGLTWDAGQWLVDDAMDTRALTDPTDPRNLANRFDTLLSETMVENEHSVVKRWSLDRLAKDLGWAESMTSANRLEMYKSEMATKAGRATIIRALQPQLQHGLWNRAISIHGAPQATTASGGPGSFNLPMMSHMREQGGVMSELGMEFAGRLGKQKADEAVDVYRRLGAFYSGVSAETKVVDIDEMVKHWDFDKKSIGTLFGRNQYARDNAFGQLAEKFGLGGEPDHIFFKSGDTTIYHPRQISGHTGAYTTPDGRAVMSGVDSALQNLIYAHKAKNEARIAGSLSAYEEEAKAISVGRNQAPSKMYSGKLQGSMRAQARPQLSDDFMDYIGKNYHQAAGIRESQYRRMLADMGAVGEEYGFDERIKALRAGEEAAVVARQPGTELHRISAMNLYSIDEAVRTYSTRRGAERTTAELSAQVKDVSYGHHKRIQQHMDDLEVTMDLQEANKRASARVKAEHDALTKEITRRETKNADRRAKGQKEKGLKVLEKKRARRSAISGQAGADYTQKIVGDLTAAPRVLSATEKHGHWTRGLQSALLEQMGDVPIFLPEHMEAILGADYDDDQLDVILAKNRGLAGKLQERASFHSELLRTNASLADASRLADSPEKTLAAADYRYKKLQGQLIDAIKNREPGVTAADELHPYLKDGKVNPAWMERKRGQALMASMEKGFIGQMTNTVDFTRDVLRAHGAERGDARLFAEMMLGVLPEGALKARGAGPQQLVQSGLDVAITGMKDILGGGDGDMSAKEMKTLFDRHFRTIYDPTGKDEFVTRMLGHSGRVIEAIRSNPGSLPHNALSKALKRKPEDVDTVAMRNMIGMLQDHGVSSVQSRAYGSAIEGTGILAQNSERARHLKNTASTFSDVYDIMKTHKKPALIGGAIALGTSMVLASPDKVGPDAESYAGARRDASRPTSDGPQFAPTAPVSAGNGRSVRIRAKTGARFDPSSASEVLQRQYPGADVSYTMNDYRERINQEYLRKRLER